MPCIQPYRGDTSQMLLFKIASCIAEGGAVAGVASFNGRTGVVTLTSADVIAALGCTPACDNNVVTSFNGRQGVVTLTESDVSGVADGRYVLKSGDTMTGSLNIANSAVLVASDPALDITQTWNNAAVTFTGLNSNITNTASNTNSNLFNFQFDGIDRFNFTPGGSFRVVRQDASDSGMNLFLRKRGNAGGATNALASDATIGTVAYSGWNGAAFVTGSRISGLASEVWTGIANGSRIDLYTTPIGSVTEQITLRLDSTGQAKLLDGTAALPALTFQSDPDTGIYRIGANVLGTSVGGVRITSVNSVGLGIGTDAATFKLSLVGTATTADRKIGINGVQVVYLPDQAAGAFLGSIFFGTGGTSLAHAAGTEGQFNTGVGVLSLSANTTGDRNTAVGYQTLSANTTGTNNIAVGYRALAANTSGTYNLAIGIDALVANTTGFVNIAVGYLALGANTTGFFNLAFGNEALSANTTGTNNTGIGYRALFANLGGDNNTAIGLQALGLNTTGANGTAIGYLALGSNTTGNSNTAIGFRALFDLTTPATGQNTAIGYNTGRGITTGNNNTILGANVAGLAAALSNNIILADGAGVIRLQIDSSGNTTLAGTVATAAGTAALPAHTFSADLDTGIYRIGANHLGVSANGALVLGVGAAALGFFAAVAAAPVAQQVSGANLTNNVTAGGVNDTIADYADLVIYANDAAAIRNDIYQLARKLKQVNDALRAYGLLT